MSQVVDELVTVYKVDQGRGNEIWLSGIRESGEKIWIKLLDHWPHMYTEPRQIEHPSIRDIEQGHKSIDGMELQKVVVNHPGDVRELRDVFLIPHEADLPYTQRCLVDLECLGVCRVKMAHVHGDHWVTTESDIEHVSQDVDDTAIDVCYYDIEVASSPYEFPLPSEARQSVISIVVYDKREDDWLIWSYHPTDKVQKDYIKSNANGMVEVDHRHYHSERKMMMDFGKWFRTRRPGALAGWYSAGGGDREGFDWPYLINRLRRLGLPYDMFGANGITRDSPANAPGTLLLDLLSVHKATSYGVLKNNQLKTVADAYLDVELEKVPGNIMNWWKSDLAALLEYNLRDVEATWLIDEERDYSQFAFKLYFFTFVDNLGDIHKASITHDVALLKRCKGRFAAPMKPSKSERGGKRYKGALVADPMPGLHEWVASFDVKSLYPTCMVAANLSYETYVENPEPGMDVWTSPMGHSFRQDERGIVAELTQELMDLSDEYRGVDAKKYWASKIMRNCFSGDTEIVTVDGIRNIKDVKVGDEVYSINPETLETDVKQVIDTQKFSYDGEMVGIESKHVDFLVTPNHRMLVDTEYTRGSPEFIEAGELNEYTQYNVPLGTPIVGDIERSQFSLPYRCELTDEMDIVFRIVSGKSLTRSDIAKMSGIRKSRVDQIVRKLMKVGMLDQKEDTGLGKAKYAQVFAKHDDFTSEYMYSEQSKLIPRLYNRDDWVELTAWYVAEGSLHRNKRRVYPNGNICGESKSICISQQDVDNRDRIRQLLDRMGLPYSESDTEFRISNPFIYRWFYENCGEYSQNKRYPEYFNDLSVRQREILLDVLMLGDGDRHGGNRYTTLSDTLKDLVVDLLVGLGYKPMIRNDGCWRIRFSKNVGGIRMYRNGYTCDNPDPDGMVYCVTVEDNHTVMAGRNGKFQWIGQSLYGVNGYTGFRFYKQAIAETTTELGREIVTAMIDWADRNGYDVVYSDTDSAALKIGREDVMERGQKIADDLTLACRDRASELDLPITDIFDVQFETVYERILVAPVKKRYAYYAVADDGEWLENPYIGAKGFDVKRSDTPALSVELQNRVFEELLANGSPVEDVVNIINKSYVNVRDGNYPINKVAATPRLSKPISEYKSNHYGKKAAEYSNEWLGKRYGSGDRFCAVYVNKVPPGYQRTNVVALDEDDDVPSGFEVDWEKLAEVSVKKKFETILDSLGKLERLDAVGTRSLKDFE